MVSLVKSYLNEVSAIKAAMEQSAEGPFSAHTPHTNSSNNTHQAFFPATSTTTTTQQEEDQQQNDGDYFRDLNKNLSPFSSSHQSTTTRSLTGEFKHEEEDKEDIKSDAESITASPSLALSTARQLSLMATRHEEADDGDGDGDDDHRRERNAGGSKRMIPSLTVDVSASPLNLPGGLPLFASEAPEEVVVHVCVLVYVGSGCDVVVHVGCGYHRHSLHHQ